jgi:hypothetical protein
MPIPPNPGKPAHSSLRPTYFDTLKNFPTLGTGPLAAAPRETGPRPPRLERRDRKNLLDKNLINKMRF